MNFFGNKVKVMPTDDPKFPFMVGRLAGAAEMAALLMMDASQSDKLDLVAVGGRLDLIARWFIDDAPTPMLEPARYPEYEHGIPGPGND